MLKQITSAYMEKIGFGNQPYLVYQHHDSGHPPVHIVTTNIREDNCKEEEHTEQSSNSDHKKDCNGCSPFSICSSAHGFTINTINISIAKEKECPWKKRMACGNAQHDEVDYIS